MEGSQVAGADTGSMCNSSWLTPAVEDNYETSIEIGSQ